MVIDYASAGFVDVNVEDIIGTSAAHAALIRFIERAARVRSSVLLQGESGTGKELVAKAIHDNSVRARGPYIAVNCGALTPGLLGSELFGHEKGAFTGAISRRLGYFERANGGTLFLDEIGELPMSSQAMLLRVLQESKFERVGGEKVIEVDVRLIAATNVDLKDAVMKGDFRKDLYFRVAVMFFGLTPLHERGRDVVLLTNHFIRKFGREIGKDHVRLTSDAEEALLRYTWPGNVRELENLVDRSLAELDGDVLRAEDLRFGPALDTGGGANGELNLSSREWQKTDGDKRVSFRDLSLAEKREFLERAMKETDGRRSKMVPLLGLRNRHQLYRLLKQFGLSQTRLD
jgi:transcriptional regulator with GAF, ATPase, and Fis domain